MKKYKAILVISDLHFPFHHKDVFDFYSQLLKFVLKEYFPGIRKKDIFNNVLIVCTGDEIDGHAWSFHESETDAMGPDQEFKEALKCMKRLYRMFPAMHLLHSNHGSLHERKAKSGQIPRAFIKSYTEAFEAPQDYVWHPTFKPYMSNGEQVLFHHGMGANAFNNAKDLGISMVQGHHHGRLEAFQQFSPFQGFNLFGMTVGCSIDPSAYAFRYGKDTAKRPKIGCGLILNSSPLVIPMILNKRGRWIGKFK